MHHPLNRPRRRLRWAGLAALAALGAGAALARAPPRPLRLAEPAGRAVPPPEDLPEEGRRLLAQRLGRHREYTSRLVDRLVLLDYEGAWSAAADLLGEPQLARPQPEERGTLNAALPEGFFAEQERLAAGARAVQRAAEARDPERLAAAGAGVIPSCVGCHAAYRGAPAPR